MINSQWYVISSRPSDAYMRQSWLKLKQPAPDNYLSPVRRQAITWTNDDFIFINPVGTNLSEIYMKIY